MKNDKRLNFIKQNIMEKTLVPCTEYLFTAHSY